MAATLNSSPLPAVAAPAAPHSLRPRFWALVAIASLLMLTACSTSSSAASAASTDPMTPALKLALGTLHLASTDQAVDAATAAQLLPLWQLMDELSTNSAASPAEITAVIEQIESTMTASQLRYIQALNLTESSVAQASQGSGASASAGSTTTASDVKASSPAGPVPGAGMGSAGIPLDGGGGMPGAASQQNSSDSTSSGASGNTALIQEVIQLLERKLQD